MTKDPTMNPLPPTNGRRSSKIVARERQRRALEMALAGASYSQIAEACGWRNKGTAYTAVQKALAEWAPVDHSAIESLRDRELARLDRLQNAQWMSAMRGDSRSAETCLRVIDRRCALLGLDAPKKVSVGVTTELDSEIEQMLKLLPAPTHG